MGGSKEELIQARDTVIYLLQHLGFVLNQKKCVLSPTQEITFLGLIVNSQELTLSLTSEKVEKTLEHNCRKHLREKETTDLDLTKIIGLLSSAAQAVMPARLQFRFLQNQLIQSMKGRSSFQTKIILSKEALGELEWWVNNLLFYNGRQVIQRRSQVLVQTYASKKGWGASCQGIRTGGPWSSQEESLHINHQELIAINYGIKAIHRVKGSLAYHIQVDNTTALAYLVKMGGSKSLEMTKVSKEIWSYLLQEGITITAEYLPGILNRLADWESRNTRDPSEWKLCPKIFQRLCHIIGTPWIDLFASLLSHQVKRYFAWKPDPYCLAVDALQQPWPGQRLLYAFPPFVLINRILMKIRQERIDRIILIAPGWQAQTLISMSCQEPILLPVVKNLLRSPLGQNHPLVLNQSLRLAAWIISGRTYKKRAFQNRLQSLSYHPKDQVQIQITNRPGRSGLAGVINNKLIHLTWIINYLADLFKEGHIYSYVCFHRSAISAFHDKIDGKRVAEIADLWKQT